MGMVFAGEDISLRRAVAIKVMNPSLNSHEASSGWQRFLREARTQAKIKHPNLCIPTYSHNRPSIYGRREDAPKRYSFDPRIQGE